MRECKDSRSRGFKVRGTGMRDLLILDCGIRISTFWIAEFGFLTLESSNP